MIKAVILDADGVLIDSLSLHLRFCEDKNIEYGLGLKIPRPDAFKSLVREGIKISPMKYFFRAVGFPPALAERAELEYQKTFSLRYSPPVFPGTEEMLISLANGGMNLGIVTANILANVSHSLNSMMQYFRKDLLLAKDSPGYINKSLALQNISNILQLQSSNILFVGDQSADYDAARTSGTAFLGVTYGWCFDASVKTQFPLVGHPSAIADYVLSHSSIRNEDSSGFNFECEPN